MKIFQIHNNFCYWDATFTVGSLENIKKRFPPTDIFVEAPDYVFEGWGYINGEFIKPTPPEGWLYDDATGTFYNPNAKSMPEPSTNDATWAEMAQAIKEGVNTI